jgi:hypothetical protein
LTTSRNVQRSRLRVETRTDGESPVAVKLALDYTLLEPPAELLQLKRLIEKATPQVTAGPEPLQIEGEAIEESEQDHQVCLPQRCDFIR